MFNRWVIFTYVVIIVQILAFLYLLILQSNKRRTHIKQELKKNKVIVIAVKIIAIIIFICFFSYSAVCYRNTDSRMKYTSSSNNIVTVGGDFKFYIMTIGGFQFFIAATTSLILYFNGIVALEYIFSVLNIIASIGLLVFHFFRTYELMRLYRKAVYCPTCKQYEIDKWVMKRTKYRDKNNNKILPILIKQGCERSCYEHDLDEFERRQEK